MHRTSSETSLKIIRPGDPAYGQWNGRGVNLRFTGSPDQIIPVTSTEELQTALQHAVDADLRVVIRSGGHCLENFVANPDNRVIIDISQIKGTDYDPERNAFEVGAGTTLGEMEKKLFEGWGVLLPVGEHPDVGVGGHIPGGAFGFLCRQHGLAVDHLYAVELLWVDKDRQVKKTIATREKDDSNRELWWAHTGGGAGNFGVVTRYWFRSPEARGGDPADLLPRAPEFIETVELDWAWGQINKKDFHQLLSNFGSWTEKHSGADRSARSFFATMHLWSRLFGKIQLKGLVTDPREGEAVLNEFLEAMGRDLAVKPSLVRNKMSWLDFALHPFPDIFGGGKAAFKGKDALLRKPFTEAQIGVLFEHLGGEKAIPNGFVGLATYGGKVNEIAPDATAAYERKAIFDMACGGGWMNPQDEDRTIEWMRSCYRALFKETNGVPIPGERSGGALIPHPDNDFADPELNTSGVPWHVFYYQDNYPRLRRVKSSWDPCHIFKHSLSVEPA